MRPNILIIAYACEPNRSSEPAVGWNLTNQISKFANVRVITRANNQEVIETQKEQSENSENVDVKWIYTDIPCLFWIKKNLPGGLYIYYFVWQILCFFVAFSELKKTKIDIIHHLTFGVVWFPPLTALLSKRFVWGPIGGGDTMGFEFLKREDLSSMFKEIIYVIISKWFCRLSPASIAANKLSSAIVFRTRSSERNYPLVGSTIRKIMPESATDSIINKKNTLNDRKLRIVCAGRQTYFRGYRYAIEGFKKFLDRGGDGSLVFLGHGPESDNLENYCKKLGVTDTVTLLGYVPSFATAQEILSKGTVFLHPSFRDGNSWAVIEAMAYGLPVIAQNIGGLADMVTDSCGLLITTGNPEDLSVGICNALFQLYNDPKLLTKLGRGAQERIENKYRWKHRGEEIRDIYTNIFPDIFQ